MISVHITKHLAALSIALSRNDITIINVQLTPATKCLRNCIKSMEEELNDLETPVRFVYIISAVVIIFFQILYKRKQKNRNCLK